MKRKKKKRKSYFKHYADRHHIFYTRKAWRSHTWANTLRNEFYCVPTIEVETHRMIHECVPSVPLPTEPQCQAIWEHITNCIEMGFFSENEPFPDRLRRLITICSIFGAEDTASALKEQLKVIDGE